MRHLSCEEGTHRSEVIVSSLRKGSFCTAFGSYFVLLLSCLPAGQTRRMWRVRQGSSLTWLSMRIRLQRRKPGETNKHFDLIVLPQDTIRPIRKIRGGDIYTHPLAYGVAHHKKITTHFMILGMLVVCLIMMHSVVGLYKLLWSTGHRTFGRPTRDAMVDRPKELWSTDQRPLERRRT